jgi:hypothetical protein
MRRSLPPLAPRRHRAARASPGSSRSRSWPVGSCSGPASSSRGISPIPRSRAPAFRGGIEESALGDPPARAIAAARALLLDPVHHSWVRTHWGEDYLHEENVFFRALLIGGLGADVAMTNDARARAVLLEQTESLAADLDRSPLGLLNDYPEECYPTPYLGELALAYFLTVPPVDGAAVRAGGHTPYFVWLAFLVYWALPISLWIVAWRALRASSGRRPG